MKKLISCLLALCLVLGMLPLGAAAEDAAVTGGVWSGDVLWSFDEATGTLSITGSGDMEAYYYDAAPCAAYREQIVTIEIGADITAIDRNLYYYDTRYNNVSAYVVDAENSVYSSLDGILYSADGTNLIRVPKAWAGDLVIPEGITQIGEDELDGCRYVTSLTLPASLTYIDTSYCLMESLEKYIVHEDNAYYASDDYGVLYNKAMTAVQRVPWAIEGEYVVPETVTYCSPDYSLRNCHKLTGIRFGSAVSNLDDWGEMNYFYCASLEYIYVDDANPYFCTTEDGILYTKDMTKLLRIPMAFRGSHDIPEGVTTVENCAADTCPYLTAVTFPESLKGIGQYAFWNCISLAEVEIPAGVENCGWWMFDGCVNVKKLVLNCPASAWYDNSFGNGMFGGMTAVAYYPGEDTTYTPTKLANDYHGGELTWVPFGTVSSGTCELTEEGTTVAWTAPADGTLTVSVTAADPGWAYRLQYPDGSTTVLTTGTDAASNGYSVTAGEEYVLELYAYDRDLWSMTGGTVSYELSFDPDQMHVERPEYLVSDTVLTLGENSVTAEDAVTTIFAFTPDSTGTYRFTAGDENALLGYWGGGEYYLSDSTGDKSSVLEHTVTAVGQTVMVGLSYTDGCVITVEKVAEYVPETFETVVYANTHDFLTLELKNITPIDVFDGVADTVVLGADGFYHYGSENGPLVVVDLQNIGIDVGQAIAMDQMIVYAEDDQGNTVRYDYNNALGEYYQKGAYPVTQELGIMLENIGQAKGWYTPGGFLYETEPADTDISWLGICGCLNYGVLPELDAKYPALSFEDAVVLDVYFSAAELDNVQEVGMVLYSEKVSDWSLETGEVLSNATLTDSGLYVCSTPGIAAKDLNSTLYFAVYALMSDGSCCYTNLIAYSPANYAYNILNGDYSANLKSLAASLLRYGAEAQAYFGVNTENPADASMTQAHLEMLPEYSSDMAEGITVVAALKQGTFANNGGFTRRYPNITLDGEFCINYHFIPASTVQGSVSFYFWDRETFDSAEILTPDNATSVTQMTGGGEYIGSVTGIAAKDLDRTLYVAAVYTDDQGNTCTSGVLAYSLGAYCASVAAGTGDMQALAEATMVYAYCAQEYFA